MTVFTVSHGVAALASLVAAAYLLIVARDRHRSAYVLLLLVWTAGFAAAASGFVAPGAPLFAVLDIVRTGVLIWATAVTLAFLESGEDRLLPQTPRDRAAVIGAALAIGLVAVAPTGLLAAFARIGLAVAGLVFVQAALQAAPGRARWGVKLIVIGAGSVFVFDLLFFTFLVLNQAATPSLELARPFVSALAAPLFAVGCSRLSRVRRSVGLSRRVVLGGTALLASGLYLSAMAAVGFVLRRFDLEWGGLVQTVFTVGAAMVLAVLVSSDQVRARARNFLTRNFMSEAYDYRLEWNRFVDAMASGDAEEGETGLHARAIRSVCDPFDCSSGALYLADRRGDLALVRDWHWNAPGAARIAPPSIASLMRAAANSGGGAVDLDDDAAYPDDEARGFWAAIGDARLALALSHRGALMGFIVARQSRAPRPMTTEDEDLLSILGRQIGGMIAEAQVSQALQDARRFEQLSKNFSFVAHDLKNIVSQLSLIVQQAEKHGDNPEFQRDAMLTVGESVEAMQRLLSRLRAARDGEGKDLHADAAAVLQDVLQRKGRVLGRVSADRIDDPLPVRADPTSLASVVENLVQNAMDATPEDGSVVASAYRDGDRAILEIRDDGKGMEPDFVRDQLFQPFRSTKEGGFGLGMYQCREWVEAWGGALEIASTPGEGTTATVRLPSLSGPAQ